MENTLKIISILITFITAVLFSGLFSSELFVWYYIDNFDSENSTSIIIENTGLIQAKNALLFISNTTNPSEVTIDCIEGEIVTNNETTRTTIKLDRMSVGSDCIINLKGITKSNITDIVVTSENKSAYRSDSHTVLYFYFILFLLLLAESISLWLMVPFFVDFILPIFFSLFHKDETNKTIQIKIKSEFGINLYFIDIIILQKIFSEKKTLLQIAHQLKIPRRLVMRRLRRLTKYEIIDENRMLNEDIKIILQHTAAKSKAAI